MAFRSAVGRSRGPCPGIEQSACQECGSRGYACRGRRQVVRFLHRWRGVHGVEVHWGRGSGMVMDGMLVFGGRLVCRWNAPDQPAIVGGALYVEAGRIVAIGPVG